MRFNNRNCCDEKAPAQKGGKGTKFASQGTLNFDGAGTFADEEAKFRAAAEDASLDCKFLTVCRQTEE